MSRKEKIIDGFSLKIYEKLTNTEVDQSYDLTGPIGFHGFSCERWVPHFRNIRKPLFELNKNDTLKGEQKI